MYTENEILEIWLPKTKFNLKQLFLPILLILIINTIYFFFIERTTLNTTIYFALWFIVFQPLIEEYVFRHLLQKSILLKIIPKIRKFSLNKKYTYFVIILIAIIFSTTHIKSNLILYVHVFLTGLIYGYFYYKTDSILVPWILHIVNNFLSLEVFL